MLGRLLEGGRRRKEEEARGRAFAKWDLIVQASGRFSALGKASPEVASQMLTDSFEG